MAVAVDTETLLEVENLHVHLGQSHVLQGVSFTVRDGGVTALLGRNGVGKTTTLRAILGLVGRRGKVTFAGNDLTSLPTHRIVRQSVGYVPEDRDIFAGLTVEENLRLAERDAEPRYDLIYGLMGVLNFAHGAFLTVGSYASWWMSEHAFHDVSAILLRFLLGALCGLVAGAVFAALVELVLIRPLYQRHIEQVLVTVGLSLAFVALVQGIWGPTLRPYAVPGWLHETTTIFGAHIPNDRWIEIGRASCRERV